MELDSNLSSLDWTLTHLFMYVLALNMHTYCMVYVLAFKNSTLSVLGTWYYEDPYCTDSDILLFLFILTNVLIVSRFG